MTTGTKVSKECDYRKKSVFLNPYFYHNVWSITYPQIALIHCRSPSTPPSREAARRSDPLLLTHQRSSHPPPPQLKQALSYTDQPPALRRKRRADANSQHQLVRPRSLAVLHGQREPTDVRRRHASSPRKDVARMSPSKAKIERRKRSESEFLPDEDAWRREALREDDWSDLDFY